MAQKANPVKNLGTLETAVEKLQKDVEKLSALESKVTELTQQLGKLDVLDRWEKRMMEEDQRSTLLGKQPEDETQTSGMIASMVEGSQRPSVRNNRFSEQVRKSTESPEWNEPLTRNIEIPVFDGENVESRVLRVEQYFELSDFTEGEKLRVVRMCFDREALTWYRWERDRHPFSSWE